VTSKLEDTSNISTIQKKTISFKRRKERLRREGRRKGERERERFLIYNIHTEIT